MPVVLSDDLVRSTGLTETELRLEIAIALYAGNHLTLGQAARMASIPQSEMLHALHSRGIEMHYGIEDLKEDMATLARLFPE